MRQKIFFLVMLLCTVCMGSRAQSYPFEFSTSKDAADAKWYFIQFRNANGNTYAYVDNASSTQLGQIKTNDAKFATLTSDQKAFCFVQSGEGFYIYNKGTGLGVKVDAVTDRAPVKVSTEPTLIKYRLNGSDHFLYDGVSNNINNTLASWSNNDAFIAISAASSRSNYNGSRALFTDIYSINCTGLAAGETGGVCYNRVNYTGSIAADNLDPQALIAMHVSGYNGTVSVNAEANTINVVYDKDFSSSSTLWDDNGLTDKIPAARIPALVRTANGDLLAFSDWRYNKNDIGRGDNGKRIDVEMRRSTDNGATWSPAIIVAQGTGTSGYEAAHGDAAVVADHTTENSQKVLMMAASGNATDFTNSTRDNKIQVAKFLSNDNGATWTKSNFTDNIYNSLPETVTRIFFTSGKITQGTFKAASATYNRIYASLCTNEGNYVVYSDDFGDNWSVLGGAVAQAGGDEAHVTELPNGDILLDSRVPASGRMVNIFTYSDREAAQGAWGTQGQKSITAANACNGDIDVMTGYLPGSTDPVSILVQTAPRNNSSRVNVRYYYKPMPALTDGHYTLSDFVGGWTEGYQVCAGSSAYSSIVGDGAGNEYMLYERNETSSTFYYDIVFEKHSISQITNNAYLSEPARLTTIKASLNDGHGNTFEHEYEALVGTQPTLPAYCTLSNGAWENKGDHYTYTADITMPFTVSNAEKSTYYNIYFPIGAATSGKSPTYLYFNSSNASKLSNDHSSNTSVIDDAQVMTASEANTYKYSWAIEGDPFNGYKFRNRQSGTYINVAGASASGTQNAGLGAEGSVFNLDLATSGTYNGRWTMQSGTGYIVMWSWSNDVATYNTNINHAGGHFYLVEAPDFEALTADLAASCNDLGTTVGTYAYTGSANDLATAQSIVAGETTPDHAKQLKTLIASLTAGRGILNMPVAGHFYRLKSHKYGTYLSSTTGRYNNNNNVFAMTNAQDATTICLLTDDNHLVMYATGRGLCDAIQAQDAQLGGNTVLTFQADAHATPAKGCYNIKAVYSGQTKWLYAYEGNIARNGNYDPQECIWELEEVTSLPVQLHADGGNFYGTLNLPAAVALPDALKAYSAVAEGDVLTLTKVTEGGVLAANTPVILYAETSVNAVSVADETGVTSSVNELAGTIAAESVTANDNYVLSGTEGVGFYLYNSTTMPGFKAYLPASAKTSANKMAFRFEDVITAISAIESSNTSADIYDIQGRRLSKPQQGMNIINGHKVIVK